MLRDELEEVVRQDWDPEHLAIYADQLQAEGDLRGELIVLDLAVDARGPEPELVERRTLLEARWLGLEDVPADERWRIAATQYGFITSLSFENTSSSSAPTIERASAVLRRAGRYVRWIQLDVTDEYVAPMVELIAQSKLEFLEAIEIHREDFEPTQMLLGADTVRMLVAATPRLDELVAYGHLLCESFPHDRVHSVRCYDNSIGDFSTLKGVTEAALYISDTGAVVDLPALRRLDISSIGEVAFDAKCSALARCPQLPQLEWLRMEPPETSGEIIGMQAALDRAAALRELVVARYTTHAEKLRHATARIMLPPPAWPDTSDIPWNVHASFVTGELESGSERLKWWLDGLLYRYHALPATTLDAAAELHARIAAPLAQIERTGGERSVTEVPTEIVLRSLTGAKDSSYWPHYAKRLAREHAALPATTLVHLWLPPPD